MMISEEQKLPERVTDYLSALRSWARAGRPDALWGDLESLWRTMSVYEQELAMDNSSAVAIID